MLALFTHGIAGIIKAVVTELLQPSRGNNTAFSDGHAAAWIYAVNATSMSFSVREISRRRPDWASLAAGVNPIPSDQGEYR
jgi:hypothetical protein